MPGVYLVNPDDVSAELPKLYPLGFSGTSIPPVHQIEGFIVDADSEVATRVQRYGSALGAATDQAALMARRIIINMVLARIMRALNAGRAPEQVAAAAAPYLEEGGRALKALEDLGSQLVGQGNVLNRVRGTADTDLRAMLISDDMLGDYDGTARRRSF